MMLSPTHPIAALVRDASLFNSECASNAVTAGTHRLALWLWCRALPTVVSSSGRRLSSRFDGFTRRPQPLWQCPNSGGPWIFDDEAARFEDQLGVLVYVSCPESAKTMWAAKCCATPAPAKLATMEQRLTATAAA